MAQTERFQPMTTQQAVLHELRRRILSSDLKPGELIRPDAIAAQLGVSRIPVREALKILEGERQVIYRPHHGYHVARLAFKELVELYRIRRLLETEILREAIPNMNQERLRDMHEAMEDVERCTDDIPGLTRANRRFHFTLFWAADLPRFHHLVELLWDASDPYRSLYYVDSDRVALVHKEHRALYEAVLRKDIDEAIRVMDGHRSNTIERLRATLPSDRATGDVSD